MSSELDDVKRLLDAFEESDWASVHLRTGDLDVSISVDPQGVATAAPAAQSAPAGVPPVAAPVVAADVIPEPAAATDTHHAGAVGTPVVAPSPGMVWRAPSPSAPPFIQVGQQVGPETTVCIVELMKLMHNVLAGVTGQNQPACFGVRQFDQLQHLAVGKKPRFVHHDQRMAQRCFEPFVGEEVLHGLRGWETGLLERLNACFGGSHRNDFMASGNCLDQFAKDFGLACAGHATNRDHPIR